MVAIFSNNKEFIFKTVSDMYTDVAQHPDKTFHFPTGRIACLFVGYPATQLDAIPDSAPESFAGVGYPFKAGVIKSGATVLDIGSGSGTDALIASQLVSATGKVYALDMTEAMRNKLRANAAKMGANNVEVLEGNTESVPLPNDRVDVVTSNGVINLVPDKPLSIGEIYRVLKPGGRIQISDIVLAKPVSEASRNNPKLWAECVVGAVVEDDYLALFRAAGFANIEVITHFDYFSGSCNRDKRKVAAGLGAKTITFTGTKPS